MSDANTPVVELKNISFAYACQGSNGDSAPLQVLENIELRITKGEVVCLLGPSGCGKTTLLNLIAGFVHPESGTLFVRGKPARGCPKQCGMVFQTDTLFPWLTVRENVAFGPSCCADTVGVNEVQRYIEIVGLTAFGDYFPSELSGGMKQRVALARALVSHTDLLLMDEPFGSLDAQSREVMQELVANIHASLNPTVVMVTHDIEEAVFLADRIVVLSRLPGRVVEEVVVPTPRPRTVSLRETVEAAGLRTLLRRHLRLLL